MTISLVITGIQKRKVAIKKEQKDEMMLATLLRLKLIFSKTAFTWKFYQLLRDELVVLKAKNVAHAACHMWVQSTVVGNKIKI